MPNRIIKDSIRTSKSVNAMSDFQFRMWAYLITYVDDFGRGSADPELLKGFVFPRRKGITEDTIRKTLTGLANIGSVILYEVDGEPYLCFPNWSEHQTVRNKVSKYPAPKEDTPAIESSCKQLKSIESNCNQLNAIAPVIQSNPESRIQNPESNPKGTRTPAQSYGAYGWVKLTPEEHARLVADLGEAETERCIAYVDESAQSNSNKNGWKDWNLVVRRCHRGNWGMRQSKAAERNAQYCQHDAPLSPLERKAVERALAKEAYDERP